MQRCSRSHLKDIGSGMVGVSPHCADLSVDHLTECTKHTHIRSIHIYCNHGCSGLFYGVGKHQKPGNRQKWKILLSFVFYLTTCLRRDSEKNQYLGFPWTSRTFLWGKASWDCWTSSYNTEAAQTMTCRWQISKFRSDASMLWICSVNTHHLKKGFWRIIVVYLFVLEHQPMSWAHEHSLHIQNRVEQPLQ